MRHRGGGREDRVMAEVAACLLGLLALAAHATADVRMPKLFGSGMVLQRGRAIQVWGKAEPGEKVSAQLAHLKGNATTGAEGRFAITLPALDAGGPHVLKIQGKNEIAFRDVLVGDVWVCSGQSNMEWAMTAINHSGEEIQAANWPNIRLFHVDKKQSAQPLDDVQAVWQPCNPENIKNFSAVAYFFGRSLHQEKKVPIGLIESAWGGTPAEAWTPPAMFAKDASLKNTSDHPHAKAVMSEPSKLYNAMIAPLTRYPIMGVIWYQGESNVPMAKYYHRLFSAMITGWRAAWGQGDFPFLYVQIAPWNYANIGGWPREGCPRIWEAQQQTLALPKTAMVVTTDIGDINDIHPRNKQDVGKRLAVAARAIAFGEKVVYSGPLYKSIQTDGNKIVVHFDHVGSGLACRDKKLQWFTIAGADKKFHPADAVIEGQTVVVHAPNVAQPVAVRMGWQDIAEPNLMNKDGLPASPFRSDDWE